MDQDRPAEPRPFNYENATPLERTIGAHHHSVIVGVCLHCHGHVLKSRKCLSCGRTLSADEMTQAAELKESQNDME